MLCNRQAAPCSDLVSLPLPSHTLPAAAFTAPALSRIGAVKSARKEQDPMLLTHCHAFRAVTVALQREHAPAHNHHKRQVADMLLLLHWWLCTQHRASRVVLFVSTLLLPMVMNCVPSPWLCMSGIWCTLGAMP